MSARVATLGVVVLVGAAGCGSGQPHGATMLTGTGAAKGAGAVQRSPSTVAVRRTPSLRPAAGLRVLRFVEPGRTIALPGGGSAPRALVTYVRYPALSRGRLTDARDAAARPGGPYPLVVFGHGFAVTPGTYARLLQAWARAGFVVAAPLFPLESAAAPGGPDESDLPNQPADMSFLITSLLAASGSSGPLAGVIDPGAIAVSGQSDGGDTALAAAYDPRFRDPRIRAAVILSGAEIPNIGGFSFPVGGPALLATQGTADMINPPSMTAEFFLAAHPPKFLLTLFGAEHLPPYTVAGPQLDAVDRVSLAFLDAYLRGSPASLARLQAAGGVPGVATLTAMP